MRAKTCKRPWVSEYSYYYQDCDNINTNLHRLSTEKGPFHRKQPIHRKNNPYTEKITHTQRMPQIWASGPQDAGVHRVGERAYTKDERQPTEGGGVHKKCARVARGTMVGGGGMAKCSILGAFSGPVAFLCWDEHLYASSLGTLSGVGVGFPLPISIIKSPYEWRKRGISVFWFAHGSSPPGPLRV